MIVKRVVDPCGRSKRLMTAEVILQHHSAALWNIFFQNMNVLLAFYYDYYLKGTSKTHPFYCKLT